jgi:sugar lactone lactonase YvrE
VRGYRILTVLFAIAGLAVASPPAFAETTHPFQGSFGDGILNLPARAAVNQATGEIYVVDQGAQAVRVFDFAGNFVREIGGFDTPAQGFSLGPLGRSGVAVDASFGPSNGDVYVADSGNDVVDVFDSNGSYERQLTGIDNPTGVAVDQSGHVWVAEAGGLNDPDDQVREYDEAGNLVQSWETGHIFTEALAVDTSGHVYLISDAFSVSRFDSDGTNETPVGDPFGFAFAIAVNPSDNHLYVDQGDTVSEFDDSGTLVNQFSTRTSQSVGIAVSGGGNVYVTNGVFGQGRVHVFGPLADVPIVTLGPADPIAATGATLHGSINPDGVASTYQFEWGTDTHYGNVAPADAVDVGDGTDDVAATADLSGLLPGTTYHYRLRGSGPNGSVVTEDGTFTTLTLPIVVSLSGSGGLNTATLSAVINPQGPATTYHFEYGLDTNYGTNTPETTLGDGFDDLPATADISGLSPNSTYHFRVVATNEHGTTTSTDATFTTNPAPSIAVESATDVGQTSATIHAQINPNSQETTYQFEYGTTTAYGSATPAAPTSIGSGTTRQHVSAQLTGLAPGTTYHFRVVATSVAGRREGSDRTFTTASPPPPPPPPPPAGGGSGTGGSGTGGSGTGGQAPPSAPRKTSLKLGSISKKRLAKWARTGKLTLKVRVGGRGKVTARALATLPDRFEPSVVAHASKTAKKAGVVRLTLKLSRAARRALADDPLHVRIEVESTGANRSLAKRVTLRKR